MTEPAYSFHVSEDALNYTFDSISEHKIIAKAIQFKPFSDNALFFNLGLGDVLFDGTLDDSTISNNHDMNRIMATVFQAILTFSSIIHRN